MKDGFLKRYRQEPSAELVEQVYGRIEALEGNRPMELETITPSPQQGSWLRLRPLAVAGLVTLLLLLLSPLFSTRARALMEDVVHHIGGLTLLETDVYPSTDDARTIPGSVATLGETREMMPYSFSLPTEVPERYTMIEEVQISSGGRSATISWHNETERGDGFWLRVAPANPDVRHLVGPDSIEVVELDGREAQFIRGGWESNREIWNPDIARMLRWQQDGVEYQLGTSGASTCPDREEYRCPLTDEALIDLAASVPTTAPAE